MTQTKVEAPFVEGGGGSSFKNLLINGDMQIWQRATAATASTSGYATVDRWQVNESSDGAITSEQSALSTADKATTGCRNALLIKCTTTDSSIASGQFSYLAQGMEGQFLSHLGWGTTSAKTLTLSFWVKAYVAGTYTVGFKKYDNTAYFLPIEYTISSSNTWEKKTIEVSPTSGSTSLITGANGAFDQDNGIALLLTFGLAWGSTYHGTSGTWASGAHFSTSNQTNFLSSTSNTFYLTGVQLEVGDQATDLEQVPFDVQLERCRRYCQQHTSASGDYYGYGVGHAASGNLNISHMQLHPNMRAAPTLETSSTAGDFAIYSQNSGVDACDALPAINGAGDTGSGGVRLQFTATGDITADNIHENISNNAVTFIRFTAEL